MFNNRIRKLPEILSTEYIDRLILQVEGHLMVEERPGTVHAVSVLRDCEPFVLLDVVHKEITLEGEHIDAYYN